MYYELKKILWLPCFFVSLPEANSVTVQIFVKAGSIYETKENNGIAHLVEHMFFKWWKKYQTAKDVAVAIDKVGGEFNAYTSSSHASYYVKVAPSYLKVALDVLSDMVMYPRFPEEELQKEKQVVLQEIAMYEDEPQEVISEKRKLWWYGDTSYGRPILGTPETLTKISQEDLFSYKNALYTKDNMVLVIVWARNDTIEQMIGDFFGWLPKKSSLQKPPFTRNAPVDHEYVFTKWTQQNHLIITAPWHSWIDEKRFAARILMTILGGNMSSRLYQNIREKHWLCYYIGWTHSASPEHGVYYIRAWLDKERFTFWLEKIYEELNKIVKKWFTKKEFEYAKWYILWKMQMWLETTDEIAQFFGPQQLLYDKVYTLSDLINIYKNITQEEVSLLLEYIVRDKLYTCYIQ